jgi:ABC-type transporter Mla subunit MlaD
VLRVPEAYLMGSTDDPDDEVAKDDGIGALTAAADGAADVLEKIPVVGGVLADNLRGLSAVVRSAQQVIGAFADRGKELGVYSGAISAASARQEVAGQLRDMREAARLGDGYAKLIDKQTEMEASLSGMLMPIKQFVVERLPALMEAGLNGLEGILNFLDKAHFGDTIFGEMAREMKKAREDAKKFGTDELESAWLSFRGGFGAVAFPPVPGALGVPLTVGAAP